MIPRRLASVVSRARLARTTVSGCQPTTVAFVATTSPAAARRAHAETHTVTHRSESDARSNFTPPAVVSRDDAATAAAEQGECQPALPDDTHIGFIGGGAMASAIAKGVGKAKLLPFAQLSLSDLNPHTTSLSELESLGAYVTSDNAAVASRSSVLFLATKPDAIVPALERLVADRHLRHDTLVVSIAAGVTLAALEAATPVGTRLVRVMPNTPALVGLSASAYTLGRHCTKDDAFVVQTMLDSIGTGVLAPESSLSAVTGLSGSGPAYVFMLVESLADGGVRAGLPRGVAMKLAVQTVLGSAAMLQETGLHPGVLKDQVASPGGTTIAGIHALERGGFRATIIDAVYAAAQRADEMGVAAARKQQQQQQQQQSSHTHARAAKSTL